MFNWIKNNRTYTLILVLVIGWFGYTGYVNVWEPVAIAAEAKEAAGESVDFVKDVIEFLAKDKILEMLKTLLPILLPIFLYKRKEKMDNNIRQKTNYVVREKVGLFDRRKGETVAEATAAAKKYKRRATDSTKTAIKKVVKKVKK